MMSRRVLAVCWAITLGVGALGVLASLMFVAAYAVGVVLASIGFRMMHDAPDEALSGNRWLAYRVSTALMVAVGVTGFASSVATVSAHGATLIDAPLAVFFVMIAILSWRALIRQSPGRVALVTYVALLAYIPLGAYDATRIHHWSETGWSGELARGATLLGLFGAGVLGLVAAVAFRASGTVAVPEARRL